MIIIIDHTPPSITFTSPPNGATGVAISTEISATFSAAMDASSLTTDTFRVLGPDNILVPGTVVYDANTKTARFIPQGNLSYFTSYYVIVTTLVKDEVGTAIESDYTWSFTTQEYAIGNPILIETNFGVARAPQIAIDNAGNATAVWWQWSNTDYSFSIWANRYVVGNGWGSPTLISNSTGLTEFPTLAMDSTGNAIVVWSLNDGTFNSIYASRYEPGTGWSTPTPIETNTGNALDPQVAMDSNGNAIVVWVQEDSSNNFSIWMNRYIFGTGWDIATTIETKSENAAMPQIAIDGNGNAIVVWAQWDGNDYTIYWNRYIGGAGWGTAAPTGTSTNGGRALYPKVKVDSNGNAILVWTQLDSTGWNIWATHYTAATNSWDTAALIETNPGNVLLDTNQVVVDSTGNAVAVWIQMDSTSTYNVWANRYVASDNSWGTPALIETRNSNADNPQPVVGNNGDVIVVWNQPDSTGISSIWMNRYVVGTGWSTPVLIENTLGEALYPSIALDTSRNATVVWAQPAVDAFGTAINPNDTGPSIWANRFSLD